MSAPISREFRSANSPEEVIRDLVLQSGQFNALGYQVETHTAEAVIMARRFTPTAAWAAPLGIAAVIFLIGVSGPNSTIGTAALAGYFVLFGVIVAIVLSLVVKTTERVTFSATPDGAGSRVLVSGSATRELHDFILVCGTSTDEPSPIRPMMDAS